MPNPFEAWHDSDAGKHLRRALRHLPGETELEPDPSRARHPAGWRPSVAYLRRRKQRVWDATYQAAREELDERRRGRP